ncbi:cold-shock protein [Streptomyces pactum]|uniref:DNA-binding protein n=1 Tax=Streptomyces pactum TaxID=68249 RepID=A0A1S6J254_9ACTN|nr:cold shock domain-containing protein [Streptomyces pactum]AQS65819.1 DNA-binding protein [Streptomyces pactum]
MAVGRVIRFDSARGYGFIAPAKGGEDIFLHVNDLLIPESYLRPGLEVEFEIEDGGRGLKASNVRLTQEAQASPTPAPDAQAPRFQTPHSVASAVVSAPAAPAPVRAAGGEEPMCDVLSKAEFTREVTEVLLKSGPGITAAQLLEIRDELVKFAESHGWVED